MVLGSYQVLGNSVMMYQRTHHYMDVPNCVSQGDNAVTLEEYDSDQVDDASCLQFPQTRYVTHLTNSQTRQQCNHNIEGSLQGFVPFMKNLLVEYSQCSKESNSPSELHSHTL